MLLLSEIFPPAVGGSGRWLSQLYERLPGEKLVFTDMVESCNDPEYVNRIPFDLLETGGFSPKGIGNYFRILRLLRRATRDVNPSHCQAARVVPEGWVLYLWNRFFGGPSYDVFAHGEEVNLEAVSEGGVMSSRQHRMMARRVFKNAERVIANSTNTASILRQQWRVPGEKVVVLNPAIDTSMYRPADDLAAVRRRLGWENRFVLLTVGRLQRRKGQDHVIEAVDELASQIPNLLYVVAGGGEEYGRLQTLVANRGLGKFVHFAQGLSDESLIEYYQGSDVFVLANRNVGADIEGFGIVLLEAAGCAKPTITGCTGGTKEAIEEGVTGMIVDGARPTEIAKAVVKLYETPDLRARMGLKGRRRVLDSFDWSTVVASLDFD
ncbi:glycosyltransferase family 4 protein [Stieleria bergensis]|uniref:glycosyltransferase family 4 protein n=1 Tax=Stieleria bergensis TaxID=2528025 RepID=UPI003AF3BAC2